MKFTRAVLALKDIPDKNEYRESMKVIHLDKDTVEATNGYLMVKIETPCIYDLCINAQDLKQIPVDSKAMQVSEDRASVTCATANSTVVVDIVDTKFPDFSKIKPEGEPVAKFSLRLDNLVKMVKFLNKSVSGSSVIDFKLYGGNQIPMAFSSRKRTADDETISGFIGLSKGQDQ